MEDELVYTFSVRNIVFSEEWKVNLYMFSEEWKLWTCIDLLHLVRNGR